MTASRKLNQFELLKLCTWLQGHSWLFRHHFDCKSNAKHTKISALLSDDAADLHLSEDYAYHQCYMPKTIGQ